jgi:hypothetical protein
MKPFRIRRKTYIRPKSRHSRNGLGFDQYAVLWRHQEEVKFKHFEARADALLSRRILRQTDPQVFYQSPFIPRPHYKPDVFLPERCG